MVFVFESTDRVDCTCTWMTQMCNACMHRDGGHKTDATRLQFDLISCHSIDERRPSSCHCVVKSRAECVKWNDSRKTMLGMGCPRSHYTLPARQLAAYCGQRRARMNRCEKHKKRLIWILSSSFLLFLHSTRCYSHFGWFCKEFHVLRSTTFFFALLSRIVEYRTFSTFGFDWCDTNIGVAGGLVNAVGCATHVVGSSAATRLFHHLFIILIWCLFFGKTYKLN